MTMAQFLHTQLLFSGAQQLVGSQSHATTRSILQVLRHHRGSKTHTTLCHTTASVCNKLVRNTHVKHLCNTLSNPVHSQKRYYVIFENIYLYRNKTVLSISNNSSVSNNKFQSKHIFLCNIRLKPSLSEKTYSLASEPNISVCNINRTFSTNTNIFNTIDTSKRRLLNECVTILQCPVMAVHDNSSDSTGNKENPKHITTTTTNSGKNIVLDSNARVNNTKRGTSVSAESRESSTVGVTTDFDSKHVTLAQRLVISSPASVRPFLELMRIDKPIGLWLLFWPCGWGLALAAGPGCLPDPTLLLLCATGALMMRGAGCTINDLWDRELDAKVERTRHRPLACGAVTPLDGVVFLGAQTAVACLVVLQLNWNTIMLGVASLGLVAVYPLVKRVSYWPQLVLGLTFNWGVPMGWCAATGDLALLPLLPLYTAAVCWTLIYDTIYAHQDKIDDLAVGVKSTALRFGTATHQWLAGFSVAMVAGLLTAGYSAGLAWPYYVATTATAATLAIQLRMLDIDNPETCGRLFRHNRHVGLLIFLGIAAGSYLQEPDAEGEQGAHQQEQQQGRRQTVLQVGGQLEGQ